MTIIKRYNGLDVDKYELIEDINTLASYMRQYVEETGYYRTSIYGYDIIHLEVYEVTNAHEIDEITRLKLFVRKEKLKLKLQDFLDEE